MINVFMTVLGALFDLRYCRLIYNLCYGRPLENQYCLKGHPPKIFKIVIKKNNNNNWITPY